MRPIAYQRAGSVDEAVQAAGQPDAAFLAGGTSLVDLMKLEVLDPAGSQVPPPVLPDPATNGGVAQVAASLFTFDPLEPLSLLLAVNVDA